MKNKILLIDDDDNIRNILSFFLEDLGFAVAHSNNGMQALPLIREHHPELIFCDLVMPGISGLTVLKQIQQEFPNQQVVMMSGLQEEGMAAQALQLGARSYLTKPLSLEQVEKILHDVFPSFPKQQNSGESADA
jgi:DNA-binding NtrC family response regulator